MSFAQLHEAENSHVISDALLDKNFQEVLSFESISASQLSHENNKINPVTLTTVF